MLCPKCGKEVGQTPTLCEDCKLLSSEENQTGTHIGAIRPALKVVRLKPGETYQEASAQESKKETLDKTPEAQTSQTGSPYSTLAGLFLFCLSILAIVFLLSPQQSPEQNLPATTEVKPITDEIFVDGVNILGAFYINNRPHALSKVEASFFRKGNFLELLYFPKTQINSNESTSPILKVVLQFAPLGDSIELSRLQNYLIEYLSPNETVRTVKNYDLHGADLGEVRGLQGKISSGEIVQGTLKNQKEIEYNGTRYQLKWYLTFKAPLTIN